MFEPWQLAMIDEAGYNGIQEVHITNMADSLLSTRMNDIDYSIFKYHCCKCGIEPANILQENSCRLQQKLNGEEVIQLAICNQR